MKGWKPLSGTEEKPPVASGVLRWKLAAGVGSDLLIPADAITKRWCRENLKSRRRPPYLRADILAASEGKPFDHAFPIEFGGG